MGWLARLALAATVLAVAGGPGPSLAPVLPGAALAQSDGGSSDSGSGRGSGSRGSGGGGSSRGGGDDGGGSGGRGNSGGSDSEGSGSSGGEDGSGSGGDTDGSDPGEGDASPGGETDGSASGAGDAGSSEEADGSDAGEGGSDPSDGGDDEASDDAGDDGGASEGGNDTGSEGSGASTDGESGSEGDAGDGVDGQGESGSAEDGSGVGGSGSSSDTGEGPSDDAGEGSSDGVGDDGSSVDGAGGGEGDEGDAADEDAVEGAEDDGVETPAAPSVQTRVDDPSPAPQVGQPATGAPVTAVDPAAPKVGRPGKKGAAAEDPAPETPVANEARGPGAAPATGGAAPAPGPARRSLPDILGAVFGGKPRLARAPVTEPAPAVEPEPVEAVVPDAADAPRAKPKEPPSAARAPRIELSSGDRTGSYRQYEISALGLTPRARQVVGALGFRVLSERRSPLLGNRIVAKLRTPGSQTASAALRRVRGLLPEVVFDYAHLYRPSGEQVAVRYPTEMIGGPGAGACRLETRIGLIDSGVGTHASLAEARIVRKTFLERDAATNVAHGTAIASILVGDLPGAGPLMPGAKLFTANVFVQDESGPRADATAIIAALDWMAAQRVPVVNLSLMGPSNALLEAAVQAAAERGQVLVAAAGNDGPGGAPTYPAAYPGVIAVAALDVRGRPYGRNNRGAYIYVAAPGVDIWGADARGGEAFWTGTSFAAPFVTAALARDIAEGRVRDVNDGRARIAANARDLGAPGRDPIFGHGLLQADGCGADAVMSSRD